MKRFILSVLLVVFGIRAAIAAEFVDHFDNPRLDEEVWNFCQADPALVGYGTESGSGRSYMALRLNGKREAPGNCTEAGELGFIDEWDNLGPNFYVEPAGPSSARRKRACVEAVLRNGEPVVQRNELRLADRGLWPRVDSDVWYFLTFKLKAYGGDHIPECGSARWVVGQWKYQHTKPGFGQSPFLAQRFDNGVLHITVEDRNCRCMIAKAGGDPDLMRLHQVLVEPTPGELARASPLECRSSTGTNGRCVPRHLKLMAKDQEDLSTLPDPKQDWVDMTYHIRAGGPKGARIDVYANGRFIVRAQGDIGPHLAGNRVKFKIGQYRDMIPVKSELLLNELCIAPDRAGCEAAARK